MRPLIAGSRIVSPQFLGSPAAPQQSAHLFPFPWRAASGTLDATSVPWYIGRMGVGCRQLSPCAKNPFWNGALWNRRARSFQAKSHLKGSVVRAEISEDRSVRMV